MPQQFKNINLFEIVPLLKSGAIGVVRVDTVYGLVARAVDAEAVAKLYQIKQRESAPGTIIGATVDQFADLGFDIGDISRVQKYWPAPLSVVLDASGVPDYLKQDRSSLPVRIPNILPLQMLMSQVGPLMTTSANRHGEPTALTIDDAVDYFADTVDFYVDGGRIKTATPSTIIGFDPSGALEVYREGAYPISRLPV